MSITCDAELVAIHVPGKFKGKNLYIIKELCKGCGFCVQICSKKVLELGEEFNRRGLNYVEMTDESGCISCGLCQDICPDFAIYLAEPIEDK